MSSSEPDTSPDRQSAANLLTALANRSGATDSSSDAAVVTTQPPPTTAASPQVQSSPPPSPKDAEKLLESTPTDPINQQAIVAAASPQQPASIDVTSPSNTSGFQEKRPCEGRTAKNGSYGDLIRISVELATAGSSNSVPPDVFPLHSRFSSFKGYDQVAVFREKAITETGKINNQGSTTALETDEIAGATYNYVIRAKTCAKVFAPPPRRGGRERRLCLECGPTAMSINLGRMIYELRKKKNWMKQLKSDSSSCDETKQANLATSTTKPPPTATTAARQVKPSSPRPQRQHAAKLPQWTPTDPTNQQAIVVAASPQQPANSSITTTSSSTSGFNRPCEGRNASNGSYGELIRISVEEATALTPNSVPPDVIPLHSMFGERKGYEQVAVFREQLSNDAGAPCKYVIRAKTCTKEFTSAQLSRRMCTECGPQEISINLGRMCYELRTKKEKRLHNSGSSDHKTDNNKVVTRKPPPTTTVAASLRVQANRCMREQREKQKQANHVTTTTKPPPTAAATTTTTDLPVEVKPSSPPLQQPQHATKLPPFTPTDPTNKQVIVAAASPQQPATSNIATSTSGSSGFHEKRPCEGRTTNNGSYGELIRISVEEATAPSPNSVPPEMFPLHSMFSTRKGYDQVAVFREKTHPEMGQISIEGGTALETDDDAGAPYKYVIRAKMCTKMFDVSCRRPPGRVGPARRMCSECGPQEISINLGRMIYELRTKKKNYIKQYKSDSSNDKTDNNTLVNHNLPRPCLGRTMNKRVYQKLITISVQEATVKSRNFIPPDSFPLHSSLRGNKGYDDAAIFKEWVGDNTGQDTSWFVLRSRSCLKTVVTPVDHQGPPQEECHECANLSRLLRNMCEKINNNGHRNQSTTSVRNLKNDSRLVRRRVQKQVKHKRTDDRRMFLQQERQPKTEVHQRQEFPDRGLREIVVYASNRKKKEEENQSGKVVHGQNHATAGSYNSTAPDAYGYAQHAMMYNMAAPSTGGWFAYSTAHQFQHPPQSYLPVVNDWTMSAVKPPPRTPPPAEVIDLTTGVIDITTSEPSSPVTKGESLVMAPNPQVEQVPVVRLDTNTTNTSFLDHCVNVDASLVSKEPAAATSPPPPSVNNAEVLPEKDSESITKGHDLVVTLPLDHDESEKTKRPAPGDGMGVATGTPVEMASLPPDDREPSELDPESSNKGLDRVTLVLDDSEKTELPGPNEDTGVTTVTAPEVVKTACPSPADNEAGRMDLESSKQRPSEVNLLLDDSEKNEQLADTDGASSAVTGLSGATTDKVAAKLPQGEGLKHVRLSKLHFPDAEVPPPPQKIIAMSTTPTAERNEGAKESFTSLPAASSNDQTSMLTDNREPLPEPVTSHGNAAFETSHRNNDTNSTRGPPPPYRPYALPPYPPPPYHPWSYYPPPPYYGGWYPPHPSVPTLTAVYDAEGGELRKRQKAKMAQKITYQKLDYRESRAYLKDVRKRKAPQEASSPPASKRSNTFSSGDSKNNKVSPAGGNKGAATSGKKLL